MKGILINILGISEPSSAAVVGFLGILNPLLTTISLVIGIAIGTYVLLDKIKKSK